MMSIPNNPCSARRWHFTTGVVVTADTSLFTTVAIVPIAIPSILVNVAETIAQAGRIPFTDIWISAECKAIFCGDDLAMFKSAYYIYINVSKIKCFFGWFIH